MSGKEGNPMKKTMLWALALAAMLLLCVPAMADEMVSVAQLHDQAEAMGGRWTQTFDTEYGEVAIDVPLMVPDIEELPVLTLEGAKISRELFDQITQGRKGKKAKENEFEYELEIGGKTCEFFLGREENGLQGYEAADALWIQHGAYRFSQGKGLLDRAEPSTYHYGWDPELNEPCLRGRTLTLEDAIRLWNEDIEMCFPGEGFTVQPTIVTVRGSLLTDKTGKSKAYKRDGYFIIQGEQVIGGVPLIGGIVSQYGGSSFENIHDSSYTKYSASRIEKIRKPYGVGISSVLRSTMEPRFATEEDYRTMNELARTRSVEIADVPLAPLNSVLDTLAKKIESGHIRELYAVRLGYILYSNPDMTDHAWAIPRWVVDAVYVPRGHDKHYKSQVKKNAQHGYDAPWETTYYKEILMDAQSGELILFGVGDKDTFSVPKMKTWDDA